MIFYIVFWIIFTSVVDPELFIPDPALNFPSSGSWQKFWIHADPDQTHIFLGIFENYEEKTYFLFHT